MHSHSILELQNSIAIHTAILADSLVELGKRILANEYTANKYIASAADFPEGLPHDRYLQAATLFRKAITIDAFHSGALVQLGNLLRDEKVFPIFIDNIVIADNAEKAAAMYRRARIKYPYFADALCELASLMLREKIMVVAEDFPDKVIPDTGYEQALSLYFLTLKHNPECSIALWKLGKLQTTIIDAIPYYRDALKYNPLCHQAWFYLYEAISMGKTKPLETDFIPHAMPADLVQQKAFILRAALQGKPQYAPALVALAIMIENEKITAEEKDFSACADKAVPATPVLQAASLYRTALSINPKHKGALTHLVELVTQNKIQAKASDLLPPHNTHSVMTKEMYLLFMHGRINNLKSDSKKRKLSPVNRTGFFGNHKLTQSLLSLPAGAKEVDKSERGGKRPKISR